MSDQREDSERLYALLERLRDLHGGPRFLARASAGDGWPTHGMYFFFEPGETRVNGTPRVVRVGTHALTPNSGTTLWTRLAQHRGPIAGRNPGAGKHRGSVFRLHVGAALLRRGGASSEQVAAWLSRYPDPLWQEAERQHERAVTMYLGQMPFLWLSVPTRPDGTSDRGHLERNCIALLSRRNDVVDRPSDGWLGYHAANAAIPRSGLWNVNHVDERHHRSFLDVLASYIEADVKTGPSRH